MNQILVATIIAVSIIGAGAYAASQVSEVSTASSMSSDIDIEKKSENMNVFFNGSINIINTGKDPSEIAMFRFYDSSGIKVHQVMIPDENGRTFGANPQVSNSLLTSNDATLPRHTTQSFSLVDLGIVSLVDLGIVSLEDITGELVTKRGRTFPISFDERTNQNGDGTDDGIIEAVEKFLDEWTNQNGVGTGNDIIEAVEKFLDEWTNQNGVGTGYGTIEAIEEFLEELKTNQNGVGTGDGTIKAIEEFLEELKTNQNGGGKTLTDGLGVYLAIQRIDTNGKVYFGSGDNPGLQTDIRPYVGVNQNDDWAIAISDDDVFETLDVPEFAKKYKYNGNKLVDVTLDAPNKLGYYHQKIMSGSPIISRNSDGITISGTGTIVMKLYSYGDGDGLWFRGALNNADVKIVTSPLDLSRISMSGNKYVLYEYTSPPISLINTVEEWHRNECAGGCHGGYYLYDYSYSIVSTSNIIVASDSDLSSKYNYNLVDRYKDHSCAGKNSPGCFKWVEYSVVGSLDAVVSSRPTGDDLLVTSLSSSYGYGPTSKGPLDTRLHTGSGTTAHTLLSTAPWNEEYSFDSNFEQYIELPYDSYIVANLNDGNVVIKGENFNPDAFFQVKGLPSHVAYDISKNGITGVIGKTNHVGKISLSRDDVDFGISTSPGGILKIYPNSSKYLGSIDNAAMIDVYNGGSVPLDRGTNLVYIPQAFVRLVFPVAVEVKNVSVDDTKLEYLNKNYAKNDALMIPVIPGSEIIYATINGEDVEVLMRYVSAPTQIKHVISQSSTTSDHATSGVTSASSNISTSTFLTATHTGTMVANIDLKVGASADFSMNSNYVGGFTSTKRCNAYSSNNYGNQCTVQTAPNNRDAVSNIDSLTSAHQSQLVTALDNGQLSQITVEVDIFKNLQYVETKSIYTSNSAYASVTSTLSTAGYGASNQVRVDYPLTSISEYVTIPVDVGDMMEFVVRVNLQALGAPTPSSVDGVYSSYVRATTEFGGGVITIGMS